MIGRAIAIAAAVCSCRGGSAPAPTHQFVTETAVIRAGDRLPSSSVIASKGVISLRAVRGETVSVVTAFSGAPEPREVVLGDFGAEVSVRRFAVEMVPVVEASSAMFGPSRGPGQYPDRLVEFTADAPPASQVLLDIKIDRGARPGSREVSLSIGGVNATIRLDILPLSIDLSRGPLVWVWYNAAKLAGRQDELAHQELFLEHGALLATDPGADELEGSEELIVSSALYWPVRVRSKDPATLESNARQVIDFFRHRAQTPFTIPIDEPQTDEARRAVVENGRILRRAGAGPKRLLHAVTDRQRPIYEDAVDVFIAPTNVTSSRPEPRLRWTYNGRPPDAGNMTIDSRGGSLRSWGWIAFRYQVELWYAWHGLYYTDRYNGATEPTDLQRSMITFDQRLGGGEDYGNGDGLLVYPNRVPSLRLKALRRGLQDRLLLSKLVACGGRAEAEAIAAATIPRALGEATGLALWPADEAGWEKAREAVLDALSRRCPAE